MVFLSFPVIDSRAQCRFRRSMRRAVCAAARREEDPTSRVVRRRAEHWTRPGLVGCAGSGPVACGVAEAEAASYVPADASAGDTARKRRPEGAWLAPATQRRRREPIRPVLGQNCGEWRAVAGARRQRGWGIRQPLRVRRALRAGAHTAPPLRSA